MAAGARGHDAAGAAFVVDADAVAARGLDAFDDADGPDGSVQAHGRAGQQFFGGARPRLTARVAGQIQRVLTRQTR
ncbi:hypothetical protein ACFQ0O_17455 [Saccharopolyspora spinosporotrichia]